MLPKRKVTLFGREVVVEEEVVETIDITSPEEPSRKKRKIAKASDNKAEEDKQPTNAPATHMWEGDLLIKSEDIWKYIVHLFVYNCKIELPPVLYIDSLDPLEWYNAETKYAKVSFDMETIPENERDEIEYVRFFSYLSTRGHLARIVAGRNTLFLFPPKPEDLRSFSVDSKVKCYVNLSRARDEEQSDHEVPPPKSIPQPSTLAEEKSRTSAPQEKVEKKPIPPPQPPTWQPKVTSRALAPPQPPTPPAPPAPVQARVPQPAPTLFPTFQPFRISSPPGIRNPQPMPIIQCPPPAAHFSIQNYTQVRAQTAQYFYPSYLQQQATQQQTVASAASYVQPSRPQSTKLQECIMRNCHNTAKIGCSFTKCAYHCSGCRVHF